MTGLTVCEIILDCASIPLRQKILDHWCNKMLHFQDQTVTGFLHMRNQPLVIRPCRFWQWLQKLTINQNFRRWYSCNKVSVQLGLALREQELFRHFFKGRRWWAWYYLLLERQSSCSLRTEFYPLMDQWRWPSCSSPYPICTIFGCSWDCLQKWKSDGWMWITVLGIQVSLRKYHQLFIKV